MSEVDLLTGKAPYKFKNTLAIGFLKSEDLAKNHIGLGRLALMIEGSILLKWLDITMIDPLAGMFSAPYIFQFENNDKVNRCAELHIFLNKNLFIFFLIIG